MQQTFYLQKSDPYIFDKNIIIEQKIKKSGLKISERWKARLSFGDIFKLYNGWIPRLALLMRFPLLFKLDMIILEGNYAVSRMNNLKHKIRYEILGWDYRKGRFLHTPDSIEEARIHKTIISKRIIEVFPVS